MATFTVTELTDERTATAELGGKAKPGATRHYVRVFQVATDSELVGPQAVLLAPGIPRLTEEYRIQGTTENDRGALCVRVTPKQIPGSRVHWTVTAEYSSDSDDAADPAREIAGAKEGKPGSGQTANKDSGQQNNPLSKPPKIQLTYERFVKALVEDLDGFKAMNSAREPFDPPIEYEELRPVLRITSNEAEFNLFGAGNRVLVNKAAMRIPGFGTAPPGTVRQVGIEVSQEFESGVTFYVVTREYIIFPEGDADKIKVLDMGLRENVLGELRPITKKCADGIERAVSSPVPLDGGLEADTPAVLPFRIYHSR